MDNDQLIIKVQSFCPEAEIEEGENQFLNISIPSTKLHSLAKSLKEDEETSFDYLFCLSGVDWLEFLTVVYHLKSTKHGHSLVLKAKITDREKPKVESVVDLWQTAEFHERETYDLFGIKFLNHPDLRRIFLTDDWVGWPLRKDYEDPINIVEL